MSATGLTPYEQHQIKRAQILRVPKERLAEYDRLMATQGIAAVLQALEADREHRTKT